MKTNNYPSWLVPIEIAKKLKKIGFNEECCFVFVYKDENVCLMTKNKAQYHYIDDINKDNYNRKVDIYSIPTWGQVFELFRKKGFNSAIRSGYSEFYKNNEGSEKPTLFYEYSIGNFAIGDVIFIVTHNNLYLSRVYFETYEEAREALVNKLIELYGNNI